MVGSYATGDSTPDSDLDLSAIGEGPPYQLEIQDDLLVSVGWASAEDLQLAGALAIHRRILYGSENRLWSLVADELGAAWRTAQASALGLTDDDHQASCRSAAHLFELAVQETREVLDDRQLAVVEHALSRGRNL